MQKKVSVQRLWTKERKLWELDGWVMLWVENRCLCLLRYETCDREETLQVAVAAIATALSRIGAQQLGSSQLTPTATSSGWSGNSHASHQSCRKLQGSNFRATSVFWLNEPNKGQSWVWYGCVASGMMLNILPPACWGEGMHEWFLPLLDKEW